jgi:hypothetical protein
VQAPISNPGAMEYDRSNDVRGPPDRRDAHEVVLINGVTVAVKVAHVRLCHSRMLFVRAYPRETQEIRSDRVGRRIATRRAVHDCDRKIGEFAPWGQAAISSPWGQYEGQRRLGTAPR